VPIQKLGRKWSVNKAGAYASEALLGAPLYGKLLPLTTNIRLGWKGLPGKKHAKLIRTLVNYGRKKFYNTWPRCWCRGRTGSSQRRRWTSDCRQSTRYRCYNPFYCLMKSRLYCYFERWLIHRTPQKIDSFIRWMSHLLLDSMKSHPYVYSMKSCYDEKLFWWKATSPDFHFKLCSSEQIFDLCFHLPAENGSWVIPISHY